MPQASASVLADGNDAAAGARNLLMDAVGLRPGESLLVVVEPPGERHYRDTIGSFVAEAARRLGAKVHVLTAAVGTGPEDFPDDVREAMRAADHTLFFNRIGDHIRFTGLPGVSRSTMAYTLDLASLGAWFGRLPVAILQQVRERLLGRIAAARHGTIRCARGTDLHLELPPPAPGAPARMTQFTVRDFPAMIFPPVSARAMSGRLVLTQALTSTSIHRYDDPILPLPAPLTLDIENGAIVRFSGPDGLGETVAAHFGRVAKAVGIDPHSPAARSVGSWHTGINPTTFFAGRALDDMERWGAVAFGSPRYTHFHMCGTAPGDICGQLFDATIAFDGDVLWENGHFRFLDTPDIQAMFAQHGVPRAVAEARLPLGV